MNIPLNPKIFDTDVEQAPIRAGFGEGLLLAGRADERVVAMCCDLTESTKMDAFAKEFPKRFFEMGIMEQSSVSVASGAAAMGKIPFVSSYAMFSPGRSWEQIRTNACYNDQPVKIVGSHAGVSVGPDGGTHQAIEDIAIMRVLPRMVVVVPCDSIEARKATLALAKTNSPAYIRLAREKTPIITTEETPFEIGKAQVFYEPNNAVEVGIIACGGLVHNAMRAAHDLDGEGLGVAVMNLATVKPLDREGVINFAKRCKVLVTVEEHQVAGGVGSAIAELLAEEYPMPMHFVGVRDQFGQSGTPDELIKHYGMDAESIKKVVREVKR